MNDIQEKKVEFNLPQERMFETIIDIFANGEFPQGYDLHSRTQDLLGNYELTIEKTRLSSQAEKELHI